MNFIKFCIFAYACIGQIPDIFCNSNELALLEEHLTKSKVKVSEGHICKDLDKTKLFKELLDNNNWVQKILEVGFNAGHSSVLFLSSRPDIRVLSFDIGKHGYVKNAKDFVDMHFPKRHKLILGDSTKTIPAYARTHNNKYDLIFIDGGHSFNVALSDIINLEKLSHEKTIVIIDDINLSGVSKAYLQCVDESILIPEKISSAGKRKWAICKYKK
jgi:predicted O-methyltransferase YrrM